MSKEEKEILAELISAAKNLLCHHRVNRPPFMSDTLKERIKWLQDAIAKAETLS